MCVWYSKLLLGESPLYVEVLYSSVLIALQWNIQEEQHHHRYAALSLTSCFYSGVIQFRIEFISISKLCV